MKRRLYLTRKWILLATLTLGTAAQLSACREETALFGVRWAFSTFTLPFNVFFSNLFGNITI